ncbi:MAG: sulfoxide reductase heme-binding subunit YedZ [Gemmatimonadetes bacterium]|nr:sulfoxide reductase heme-binding subunit YedZ [Gemmatimonadota bacterium]
MTQGQWIQRVVKPVAFGASLLPLADLVRDIIRSDLGANPIEEITHRTGLTALTFLAITLGVTPLRRLLSLNALVHVRRMFGLYVFFYATLHFTIYWLDRAVFSGEGLSMGIVLEDIAKRPYVTVGFTAFVMLVPLAVTSTAGWVKRLGSKRWQRLHQLVYVAAALGVLHFLWLVKADVRRPVTYGLVLVGLLGWRLVVTRLAGSRRAGDLGRLVQARSPLRATPAFLSEAERQQ